MNTTSRLAGLGEDPADLNSDNHPYLRLLQAATPAAGKTTGGYLDLAQRRLRTQRLTPGGLPQPPELAGVDADARVPNVLQPMAGEFAGGQEVAGGATAFHNPGMPAPTGIASQETAAPGLLQQARGGAELGPVLLAGLDALTLASVGNEHGFVAGQAPPNRPRRTGSTAGRGSNS
ncbi:MAG TPA: hypothetical protein VN515_02980 [Terriglobales bacterium]|nr:hypothetical protein [Terriglobales bacterium]